jgi:hypothetical protein
MPHVSGQHAKRNRQVSLADTRRSEEEYIAALVQESSRGQLVDDASGDRRLLGKLEVAQMFLIRKIAELQVQQ